MAANIPSFSGVSEEDFMKKYGNNNTACIQWLFAARTGSSGVRCAKCGKVTHHEYYKPYLSYKMSGLRLLLLPSHWNNLPKGGVCPYGSGSMGHG